MFKVLFEKELKGIFLSPKFVSTFGVCSLLIVLSIFVGIKEFQNEQEQYETAIRLAEQQIMQEESWWGIDNTVFRKPSVMQIFVSGVNNDIGRTSEISTWVEPKLDNSNYSDGYALCGIQIYRLDIHRAGRLIIVCHSVYV